MRRQLRVFFIGKPQWEPWIRSVAVHDDLHFGPNENCDPDQYDVVIPLSISALEYIKTHYPHLDGIKYIACDP